MPNFISHAALKHSNIYFTLQEIRDYRVQLEGQGIQVLMGRQASLGLKGPRDLVANKGLQDHEEIRDLQGSLGSRVKREIR